MIKLSITEEQINESKKMLDESPDGYNNNSYRGGGIALQSGKLAEICFRDYFGGKHVNNYDYDFILKNKKIDIKTKACSDHEPKPNWYCCVPTYFDQKTDYYVFARVSRNLKTIWFVGYIKKDDFLKIAKFVKAGEADPDSSPKKIWVCPTDSYYIKIKDLCQFKKQKELTT